MTKLNWGMIGGGEGSQIGPAHRLGSVVDGEYAFVAGALDHRPEEGRAYGQSLGLAADRSYGNWQEMLEGERAAKIASTLLPWRPERHPLRDLQSFPFGRFRRPLRKTHDHHR